MVLTTMVNSKKRDERPLPLSWGEAHINRLNWHFRWVKLSINPAIRW